MATHLSKVKELEVNGTVGTVQVSGTNMNRVCVMLDIEKCYVIHDDESPKTVRKEVVDAMVTKAMAEFRLELNRALADHTRVTVVQTAD